MTGGNDEHWPPNSLPITLDGGLRSPALTRPSVITESWTQSWSRQSSILLELEGLLAYLSICCLKSISCKPVCQKPSPMELATIERRLASRVKYNFWGSSDTCSFTKNLRSKIAFLSYCKDISQSHKEISCNFYYFETYVFLLFNFLVLRKA